MKVSLETLAPGLYPVRDIQDATSSATSTDLLIHLGENFWQTEGSTYSKPFQLDPKEILIGPRINKADFKPVVRG